MDDMDEAERIWQEKSDDDLIEAAGELEDFTEQGQAIIRAELKRRGLEDPVEQESSKVDPAGGRDAAPEPECLRCHVSLRLMDTNDSDGNPRWTLIGQRGAGFDPSGSLYTYVCPSCGHVDQFMDVPEDDQPG